MKSQTLEEWIAEHGGQSKFFPSKQLVTVLHGSQIDGPRIVRSKDGKVIVVELYLPSGAPCCFVSEA